MPVRFRTASLNMNIIVAMSPLVHIPQDVSPVWRKTTAAMALQIIKKST